VFFVSLFLSLSLSQSSPTTHQLIVRQTEQTDDDGGGGGGGGDGETDNFCKHFMSLGIESVIEIAIFLSR